MTDGYKIKRILVGTQQVYPAGWKPDANTLAWYKFDGDLNDYSGNNRNLTGTGSFISGGPGQVYNVTNAYCENSAFNIYGTQAFTLCLWVKVTSMPSSYDSIIGMQQGSNINTHDKEIQIKSGGSVVFQMYNNGEYLVTSSTNISTNQWYNIIATFDGSTRKLYINGANVGSGSGGGSYNENPARLVYRRRGDGTYNISNSVVENIGWSSSQAEDFYNKTKSYYGL